MDNVELEEKDIFGKEGNGFSRGINDFNFERWLVGASDYGMSIAVYEDACRHANQRIAFGKPIGRQQLNQLKVAEMAIKLKNMKNMLYETAWEADNNDGKFDPGAAAMCKYYCANSAFSVVDRRHADPGGRGRGRRASRSAHLARPACGPRLRRHRRDDDPHRFQVRAEEVPRLTHAASKRIQQTRRGKRAAESKGIHHGS